MIKIWDWSFAGEALVDLSTVSLLTIKVTVIAYIIALTLGLVFAVFKIFRIKYLSDAIIGVIEFIRLTPLLLQIFFVYYALPMVGISVSAFAAGIITLGVHYACYCSEVYRAGIKSVPTGQLEAAKALSLPRYTVFTKVVMPQAIPPVIPPLGNYLVALFKETPMLSTIGLVEILYKAQLISSATFRPIEPLTIAGLYFLVMSLVAAIVVRLCEHFFSLRKFGV